MQQIDFLIFPYQTGHSKTRTCGCCLASHSMLKSAVTLLELV